MFRQRPIMNLTAHSIIIFIIFILAQLGCESPSKKADGVETKNSQGQKSIMAEPVDYARLIGRWLRPDGGYIVEIQKVDINGKIDAAYYNPRSINVAQALAAQKDGIIEVFIELRDTGYPGATYTLKYDKDSDILVGLYYQPAAGQTFDVQFIRKE